MDTQTLIDAAEVCGFEAADEELVVAPPLDGSVLVQHPEGGRPFCWHPLSNNDQLVMCIEQLMLRCSLGDTYSEFKSAIDAAWSIKIGSMQWKEAIIRATAALKEE